MDTAHNSPRLAHLRRYLTYNGQIRYIVTHGRWGGPTSRPRVRPAVKFFALE